MSGHSRPASEKTPNNGKGFKTLQEAQNQENTKLSKARQIKQFVQNLASLESAFTASDIKSYLQSMDKTTIHGALKQLTFEGKLILLQEGDKNRPTVWIRPDVLKKWKLTPAQALDRYYEISGLARISKIEQIQQFTQTLPSAFSSLDIKEQFPDLSIDIIREALKKLSSDGRLSLLQQNSPNRPSVWIRPDVLKIWKLTPEQALDRYYELSGLATISKLEQVQLFARTIESTFSFLDIKKHLSNFSTRTIHRALNRMVSEGELILLEKGKDTRPNIWIRADILKEKGVSKEEVLKEYYELSGLSAISKTKQVQEFIQTLPFAFTALDVQRDFSDSSTRTFSIKTIKAVLKRMTSKGELTLLKQGQGGHSLNVWIRTAVLTKYIQLFIQTLPSAFTISDIQESFPGLSQDQVYKAVRELTSQGKISFVLEHDQLKWIRIDLSSKQSFTQEELESTKRPAETISDEVKQIIPFIENLAGRFDISYIKEQFPNLSLDQIYEALRGLTVHGKTSLVLHKGQLKWVRADLLPEMGMTWEEVSKHRVESWLIANRNLIMPFIEGTEKAFSVSDIKKRFPNLSDVSIDSILNKLRSETYLILLQEDPQSESSLWIRADLLHKRGLSIKNAMDEYYESEKDFSFNQPLALNGRLKGSYQSLNGLKPRGSMQVLFSLANSFRADIRLSEKTKTAFREIIQTYPKLGEAFFELVEEIKFMQETKGDSMSFLKPIDVLVIVWHTAHLKEISESRSLDQFTMENSIQHILDLIDTIILQEGRSSGNYKIIEELNLWFSYWQEAKSIFVEELQTH